jgi:branched-chain amino acid transport system ATP-binding protein
MRAWSPPISERDPAMTPLFHLRRFSAGYGNVEALREVEIAVPEGSIVTVIGPNGAGKSTLLNAAMGLLPSRGEIFYRGAPAGHLSVEQRVRLGICLVPERRELFEELTVADNVMLGAFSSYFNARGRIDADIRAVFEQFPQLRERRAQFAGTLSGGERQMLALGRALMSRPKLLMLDEPSLGLAPLIVKRILEIISSLRQSGISILLVEQNAKAALNIADYGYVLELGQIALQGTAKELMTNPRVVETYLGLSRRASDAPPPRDELGSTAGSHDNGT